MNFDIEHHLDAVQRSVSSVERDGKAAKAVTLVRDYPTAIDDLWDALTTRERIPRWFLPVSGKLLLGGRYQFEGNAGGEIKECNSPIFLSVTWEWQEDVSWLEFSLSKAGENTTRLTLIHTALVSEFWTDYGPGATGVGWELGLVGLENHVIDPNAPKIDEEQFSSSSEGKAFVAQSSEDWGQASIAAGTEAVEALEAAKRTTAFYTGESSENS
jgi:uncharacterized protein YndB with AHSA1/START domain